jgi:hypothetical protein
MRSQVFGVGPCPHQPADEQRGGDGRDQDRDTEADGAFIGPMPVADTPGASANPPPKTWAYVP